MNRKESVMRTRKLAVSAMLCALGVVILYLGSVINVLDLTMVAIAAIAVAVAWIIFMLRSNEGTAKVAANTAADDEWED